jgi:hypothetical protein
MGISVRNAGSGGGIALASFGAGQGRRRNQVQDLALQARERRKAQLRSIQASKEAQATGIQAQKESQQRSFEQQDRNTVFAEKSRRRSAQKTFERQDLLQDKAFNNRGDLIDKRAGIAEVAQERAFERQDEVTKSGREYQAGLTKDQREYNAELLKGDIDRNRQLTAEARALQQERIEEGRRYAEGQAGRDRENRDLEHTAAQKRRLQDLADQRARIMESRELGDQVGPDGKTERERAMEVLDQAEFGIKPVKKREEVPLTVEQKQKQAEFDFKKKQEQNKLILDVNKSSMELAKDKLTGKIDMNLYKQLKSEQMAELGIKTEGADAGQSVASKGKAIADLNSSDEEVVRAAARQLAPLVKAGDEEARKALEELIKRRSNQ